eukprot:4134932-Amphidinium_carterae.3
MNDLAAGRATFPSQWKCIPVVLLPREPLINEPKETRPIGISPVLCKLYDRLLADLLKPHLAQLPTWVCGFRTGIGTTDALWLAFQASEKSRQWRVPLSLLKIDISRAFDSLPHQCIQGGLVRLGVPGFIIQAIMQFFQWEANLHLERIIIGRIQVSNGLRQGAAIIPLLWVVGFWFILADLLDDWYKTYTRCSLDAEAGAVFMHEPLNSLVTRPSAPTFGWLPHRRSTHPNFGLSANGNANDCALWNWSMYGA